MYKSNTELIVIDAKATEPIPTNVVFWSHDKGTAKLAFELKKDPIPQSLAEGTIVPICLDFVGGRHIYHAVIEDAVNGIVSIVLEDNILGYQGRVDGSIYIELPDSRSLDTAGRFTFHIKRSPIDEDVPELEDYYWQGFSDIMEQYHESIAEIKLEAKTTLDSLTADVNTAQNKVTVLEQSITTANTNLNTRIDEINKKIDDNDVFTKAESSANVIDQIVNENAQTLVFSTDLLDKKTNSFVENQNAAYTFYDTELMNSTTPSDSRWSEFSDEQYLNISKLDNIFESEKYAENTKLVIKRIEFDVVTMFTRAYSPSFWSNRGIVTLADKITYLKKIITSIEPICYGFGSGAFGNMLRFKTWIQDSNAWHDPGSSAINDKAQSNIMSVKHSAIVLGDDGKVNIGIFSYPANESTASIVNIDYALLKVTFKISANEQIKSMIAQNHVDNLATQTEATTATDNTKTMTPLRTKQLLDSKLLNMVYPIGSIYMSVNSATPATLFGGTWERFSKGRVLVGVDEGDTVLATSGKQGGSTNPLTTHTHVTQLTTYRVTSAGSGTVNNLARSTDQGNAATGEFGATSSAGDNTDHNNWQPFTTVYMWKRTA